MKGNKELLTAMNSLLAEELTVINQYMVHSEMCENWGYTKLHKAIEKQAVDEMRHAEWLIQRILFLDGVPVVSQLNPMKIGKTVPEMIMSDYNAELSAVASYNNAIVIATQANDQGTAELLKTILKMEEDHVDWAEMQTAQVEQMGLNNYLNNQTKGATE